MFFDDAANSKGVGAGAVLISESELCKKFVKIEFKHIPRSQNEFANALATLASMIQHPDKNYIDPIKVNVQDQPTYYFHVDEEPDGEPWYYDIKRNLREGDYPEGIHGDLIRVPLNELNVTSSPWPFAAWGMDVIGPIESAASNGHKFILVAIDYFTKWVETSSYKSVTKKVVTDFVRNNIICRFGIPESIITDNGANLNSGLMHEICEKFKLFTAIPLLIDLRSMTSTGVRPYILVYGTEAVLPMEVEIPSLRIIQEAELSDAKWMQNRMAKAFNNKVKLRQFEPGQLVLKRIFPHQNEGKGKFAPNWQGPYMVHRVLTGGALILAEMDGKIWLKAINSDAVKRYYI
ncbi:uncharacterized protein [Solanum tuberosum]|uniref:uncharacterized protein n=1 Tax=Solanum tuberosum TaxID=4113 RepID=UPI00073A0CCF|nr:PREDICTED: uncharacterized protein LOC107063433 [Solanum tuberosum]